MEEQSKHAAGEWMEDDVTFLEQRGASLVVVVVTLASSLLAWNILQAKVAEIVVAIAR